MIDLADHERKAREAVQLFWRSREQARQRQTDAGKADQGERAGVTAGKNMNGFVDLVVDVVRSNGLVDAEVHRERRALTLPGFFRPTKLWDLLVINEGRLVAALEFKSQVGPSYGNNFNNRAEEVIGSAHDLWTAYREGAFGEQTRPFVGWLMLLEDAPASRCPVRNASPHFVVFEEFQESSYAQRYEILCRKLVQERLFSVAALLISPRCASKDGAYSEMSNLTGLQMFFSELAGHIASEAVRSL